MPSQILHTLFGEDVILGLHRLLENSPGLKLIADKTLEKITRDYRSTFALGCQGPDIFYHSQRLRPVAIEYGSLLHRRGYGIFSAELMKMALPDPPPDDYIRNHRREKGINAMSVYALGFMTHAILDRHCHPYIIYRAGKNHHSFFERIIDVLMLKELRNQEARFWDQEGILSDICENPPLGLKELIARALTVAFPERTQKDLSLALRIANTFADCEMFYRLTAPAKTWQVGFTGNEEMPAYNTRALWYVFPEKLPDTIDFINLRHSIWYYPYIHPSSKEAPEEDTRSFPQIYSQALEAAINALTPCIIQYLKSGLFPITEAARNIGNTNLSLQDEEGKPCSPNLIDPFPLEDVLQQQGKMRGVL